MYGFHAIMDAIRSELPGWVEYTPPPGRMLVRYWLYIGPRRVVGATDEWEIGYQSQHGYELFVPVTGEHFEDMVPELRRALDNPKVRTSWDARDDDGT